MNSKTTNIFFSMLFCLAATSLDAQTIKNVSLLYPFFEKLILLEEKKEGKVNIVHIGDSHIQSDPLINAIRKPLQQQFGDGGRGFVFPYWPNKPTTRPYSYSTNAAWQICRNSQPMRCNTGTEFGLSGYGFSTKTDQFVFSVEASDDKYKFNTIKIISPTASLYRFATIEGDKKPIIRSERSNMARHKVKSGETLEAIAKNYKVSVSAIRRENKMKTDYIYAGRNLRIPTTVTETQIDTSMFLPLEYQQQEPFVSVYQQDNPISAIYLLPTQKQNFYNLNGLILENYSAGIIYHNIGAVGATAADFNANPLFFKQLPVLLPDLVIVSFGTNESYNGLPVDKFIEQMDLFTNNIKASCPDIPILVTTPPMSLLRHKKFNTYILEYSKALMLKENVALWDLYSFLAELMGPAKDITATKISKDNVHYTSEGYANQGTAFTKDFLSEYESYKQSRTQENPSN